MKPNRGREMADLLYPNFWSPGSGFGEKIRDDWIFDFFSADMASGAAIFGVPVLHSLISFFFPPPAYLK